MNPDNDSQRQDTSKRRPEKHRKNIADQRLNTNASESPNARMKRTITKKPKNDKDHRLIAAASPTPNKPKRRAAMDDTQASTLFIPNKHRGWRTIPQSIIRPHEQLSQERTNEIRHTQQPNNATNAQHQMYFPTKLGKPLPPSPRRRAGRPATTSALSSHTNQHEWNSNINDELRINYIRASATALPRTRIRAIYRNESKEGVASARSHKRRGVARLINAERTITAELQEEMDIIQRQLPHDFVTNNALANAINLRRGFRVFEKYLLKLQHRRVAYAFRQWRHAHAVLGYEIQLQNELRIKKMMAADTLHTVLHHMYNETVGKRFKTWKTVYVTYVEAQQAVARILLQAFGRMVGQRHELRRRKKLWLQKQRRESAVSIQRIVRGYLARRLLRLKWAARMIQKQWRSCQSIRGAQRQLLRARRRHMRQVALSKLIKFSRHTILLRVRRSAMANKRNAQLRAALLVQCAWRCRRSYIAVKVMEQLRLKARKLVQRAIRIATKRARQQCSAREIQRFVRGRLIGKVCIAALDLARDATDMVLRIRACLRLQSWIRRWIRAARLDFVGKLMHHRRLTACSMIHRIWRGYLGRLKACARYARVAQEQRNALRIQAWWRATVVRKIVEEKRNRVYAALHIIQHSLYRGPKRIKRTRRVIERVRARRFAMYTEVFALWCDMTDVWKLQNAIRGSFANFFRTAMHCRFPLLAAAFKSMHEIALKNRSIKRQMAEFINRMRRETKRQAIKSWHQKVKARKAHKKRLLAAFSLCLPIDVDNSSRQLHARRWADMHSRKRLQKGVLRAWALQARIEWRVMAQTADEWYIDTFPLRAKRLLLNVWMTYCHKSIRMRVVKNMLLRKQNRTMVRRTWAGFKQFVRAQKQLRASTLQTIMMYKSSILNRRFASWRQGVELAKSQRARLKHFIRKREHRILSSISAKWRKYTRKARAKHLRLARAQKHIETGNKRRVVNEWSTITRTNMQIRKAIACNAIQAQWHKRVAHMNEWKVKIRSQYRNQVQRGRMLRAQGTYAGRFRNVNEIKQALASHEFCVLLLYAPFRDTELSLNVMRGAERAMLLRVVEQLVHNPLDIQSSHNTSERVKSLVTVGQACVSDIGAEQCARLGARSFPSLHVLWGGWSTTYTSLASRRIGNGSIGGGGIGSIDSNRSVDDASGNGFIDIGTNGSIDIDTNGSIDGVSSNGSIDDSCNGSIDDSCNGSIDDSGNESLLSGDGVVKRVPESWGVQLDLTQVDTVFVSLLRDVVRRIGRHEKVELDSLCDRVIQKVMRNSARLSVLLRNATVTIQALVRGWKTRRQHRDILDELRHAAEVADTRRREEVWSEVKWTKHEHEIEEEDEGPEEEEKKKSKTSVDRIENNAEICVVNDQETAEAENELPAKVESDSIIVAKQKKTFWHHPATGISLYKDPAEVRNNESTWLQTAGAEFLSLVVVTSTGMTFNLKVNKHWTVVRVKQEIRDHFGILPGFQRLSVRPAGLGFEADLVEPGNNLAVTARIVLGSIVQLPSAMLVSPPGIWAAEHIRRENGVDWEDVRVVIVEDEDMCTVVRAHQELGMSGDEDLTVLEEAKRNGCEHVSREQFRLIELKNTFDDDLSKQRRVSDILDGSVVQVDVLTDKDQTPSKDPGMVICEICLDRTAKTYCRQCTQAECLTCWKAIHQVERRRGHTFRGVDMTFVHQVMGTNKMKAIVANSRDLGANRSDTSPTRSTGKRKRATTDHTRYPCSNCVLNPARWCCTGCRDLYCTMCFMSEHGISKAGVENTKNISSQQVDGGGKNGHNAIAVTSSKVKEYVPDMKTLGDDDESRGKAIFISALEDRGWTTQMQIQEKLDMENESEEAMNAAIESRRVFVRTAFDLYDEDNSGTIDAEEFHHMLVDDLCEPIGEVESKKAFDELDADRSGSVDFEEMLKWFVGREVAAVEDEGEGSGNDIAHALRKKLKRRKYVNELKQKAMRQRPGARNMKKKKERKFKEEEEAAMNSRRGKGQKRAIVKSWAPVQALELTDFEEHKERFIRYIKDVLGLPVAVEAFLRLSASQKAFEDVYCVAWNTALLDATFYHHNITVKHKGQLFKQTFDPKSGYFEFINTETGKTSNRNPTLAAKHEATLRTAFAGLDSDKSGTLDRDEVNSLLRDQLCVRGLGGSGSGDTAALDRIWVALDADKSGGVSLDEFTTYYLFALENREFQSDALRRAGKLGRAVIQTTGGFVRKLVKKR